jgi:osmotically-inducible protein OsmY
MRFGEMKDLVEIAEARLRRSSYLKLRRVACSIHNGVLCLQGHVPSYYLYQVAQELVQGLDGIEAIDNQLKVVSADSIRPAIGAVPL